MGKEVLKDSMGLTLAMAVKNVLKGTDGDMLQQLREYLANATPDELREKYEEICKNIPAAAPQALADDWVGHPKDLEEDFHIAWARDSFRDGFEMGAATGYKSAIDRCLEVVSQAFADYRNKNYMSGDMLVHYCDVESFVKKCIKDDKHSEL